MDVPNRHSSAGPNKRRLTAAQAEALETSFEVEKKLAPQKKMHLAQLLGLQPRQIAVWFQNRRARWKTKQLEKDFDVLNQNYRALKSHYDSLAEEVGKLQSEARRLRSLDESDDPMKDLPEPASPLGTFLKRQLEEACGEASIDFSDDSPPKLAEKRDRGVVDREQSCGILEERDCLWSQAFWQEISD